MVLKTERDIINLLCNMIENANNQNLQNKFVKHFPKFTKNSEFYKSKAVEKYCKNHEISKNLAFKIRNNLDNAISLIIFEKLLFKSVEFNNYIMGDTYNYLNFFIDSLSYPINQFGFNKAFNNQDCEKDHCKIWCIFNDIILTKPICENDYKLIFKNKKFIKNNLSYIIQSLNSTNEKLIPNILNFKYNEEIIKYLNQTCFLNKQFDISKSEKLLEYIKINKTFIDINLLNSILKLGSINKLLIFNSQNVLILVKWLESIIYKI